MIARIMSESNGISRRTFLHRSGAGAAALGTAMAAAHESSGQETRPPNIIWIWGDNIGYGDLACYGNENVATPVVDGMANEGVRFTQFYVAHTVCSPSRAALLTGRQPWRTGIVDVLRPDGPSGLPAGEITLAQALQERGYATACIGKWHLGDRTEYLPTRHGFDHHFGMPYSMDMLPPLLYRGEDIVDTFPGDKAQNLTRRFVDDAVSFIETHKERPFFLYLAHTLPHPPLNLPPDARTPGRPIYEDAIEHMDTETGRVLDALRAHGLEESTLVIFSSDNGPMDEGGSAGGLRGRIRDTYEGGIRVPFIARWPGRIPAGRVVDEPAIAYDFFPTALNLAGGTLPLDRVYDGEDIWPLLSGSGSVERSHPMVWVYRDNVTSVREGKWKYHVADRNRPLKTPELYDIEQDPEETRSLLEENPEAAARFADYVREYEEQLPKVWTLAYPVRDPKKSGSGVRRE